MTFRARPGFPFIVALALAPGCFDPTEFDDDGSSSETGSASTPTGTTGDASAPGSSSGAPDTDTGPDATSAPGTDGSTGEPPVVCGDGVVGGDEECDDAGESAACDDDCTVAACGDGTLNVTAGETCDEAGESATCDDDCTAAECGDGTLNVTAGEQCDDGTLSNEDECLDVDGAGCVPATCGDGFVQAGVELCDDGNAAVTDDCPDGPMGSCAPALCGDGFLWTGMETCDDLGIGCGTDSWPVDPGMPPAGTSWGIYNMAPPSSQHPAVFFPMPVFGTDGNQTVPYPTDETENSAVQSPPMIIPASLDFESWHVDEGTNVDNKTFSISTDGGMTFQPIMDCNDGALNPPPGYPMCQFNNTARLGTNWDTVSIPVPAGLVGQVGIIKIDYDTLDSCCSFEQGWYMRNANFFVICP